MRQAPPKSRVAAKLEREERRKKVAANLLAGATMRQIASALGVSASTVHSDAKAVLDAWRAENITERGELLHLQNARLNQMLNALFPQAVAGDLNAVDRVLKIEQERAKLFGLYAPDVREVTVTGTVSASVDIDLANLSDEAAEALAAFYRAVEKQHEVASNAALLAA